MKVEKVTVHRLTVERDCSCKATREYSDAQYKNPIADGVYEPCKKHKAKADLAEMMGMIMLEDLEREAQVQAAPPTPQYAPLRVPNATPTTLDGTTSDGGEVTSVPITRPRPRVQAAPVANGGGSGRPVPQSTGQGPRRDPTQVRTVNRDHAAVGRRGQLTGRAPVTSVTASSPAAGAPKRGEVVQVGDVELATPGFDLDIGEEVPEDPRATRLIEAALLPDLEDDPTQA